MYKNRRPSLQQCAVLVLVVGCHVLILVMFWRTRPQVLQTAESDPRRQTRLLLIPLPAPVTKTYKMEPELQRPSVRLYTPPIPASTDATENGAGETAITGPPVDWYREAEEVVRETAEKSPWKEPKCDPKRAPNLQPHECRPSRYEFGWGDQPKSAGFAGPLPYFRLGKRCIIMPPFFGCSVGDLPAANGKLFDGMNDPDRPRSSVPGPEDHP